jgi:hypothetical protein
LASSNERLLAIGFQSYIVILFALLISNNRRTIAEASIAYPPVGSSFSHERIKASRATGATIAPADALMRIKAT